MHGRGVSSVHSLLPFVCQWRPCRTGTRRGCKCRDSQLEGAPPPLRDLAVSECTPMHVHTHANVSIPMLWSEVRYHSAHHARRPCSIALHSMLYARVTICSAWKVKYSAFAEMLRTPLLCVCVCVCVQTHTNQSFTTQHRTAVHNSAHRIAPHHAASYTTTLHHAPAVYKHYNELSSLDHVAVGSFLQMRLHYSEWGDRHHVSGLLQACRGTTRVSGAASWYRVVKCEHVHGTWCDVVSVHAAVAAKCTQGVTMHTDTTRVRPYLPFACERA